MTHVTVMQVICTRNNLYPHMTLSPVCLLIYSGCHGEAECEYYINQAVPRNIVYLYTYMHNLESLTAVCLLIDSGCHGDAYCEYGIHKMVPQNNLDLCITLTSVCLKI